MESFLASALKKIVDVLHEVKVDYMIVGGFAVSYHNRGRTTNDIDLVVQLRAFKVKQILAQFPQWLPYEETFTADVAQGRMFNLTDFETGIRYDFMPIPDSDYDWIAFRRREWVNFMGVACYIAAKEDLILSKLKWYNLTPSEKQWEDLQFLMLDQELDQDYLTIWSKELNLETHGLLG